MGPLGEVVVGADLWSTQVSLAQHQRNYVKLLRSATGSVGAEAVPQRSKVIVPAKVSFEGGPRQDTLDVSSAVSPARHQREYVELMDAATDFFELDWPLRRGNVVVATRVVSNASKD